MMKEADGEAFVIRESVWLLTDSLGLSSYALRSCYGSWLSFGELQNHYWEQLDGWSQAAAEVHDNVIASEEELNT